MLVPRDYQEDAINSIVSELKLSDRCHAVMACGSGKTLVSLWVCESLKVKKILVLMPTIQLISQIIKEWESNTKLESYDYIVVCSDKTVIDGINIDVEREYGIPVSTDKNMIKGFLSINNDVSIVFSTYASSDVLCDSSKGFKFDIAIFDEAHKVAGSSNLERHFSMCLHEVNIKIKKRVFFTATPKHSKISDKQKETFVYSMDDEAFFGKRAYTLSLNDAINRNIVTDYKIIVPIYSEGEGDGDSKTSAFLKAVNESKSSKILVFHNTIQQSIDFVENIKKSGLMTSFVVSHIDGSMHASQRNGILSAYKKDKNVIISNAKCLTEGINVPSIDMVIFYNNKNSVVDVVQATGRAIRLSEGKKFGYICIPLVNNDAYINYSIIYNILKSMSEADKDLFDYIKKQQSYGNTLNLDKNDKIVFINSGIEDNIFKDISYKINIKILERSGICWYQLYDKYKDFICSDSNPFEDVDLKRFIKNNRDSYKKGIISKEKKKLLEDINFKFEPFNDINDKYLEELRLFISNYKDSFFDVSLIKKYNLLLYRWVLKKIGLFRNGKLPEDIIKKIEDTGFVFTKENLAETKWNNKYDKYVEGIRSRDVIEWAKYNRKSIKNGTIKNDKLILLKKAGFPLKYNNGIDDLKKSIHRFKDYIVNAKIFSTEDSEIIRKWFLKHKNNFIKEKMSQRNILLFKENGIDFENRTTFIPDFMTRRRKKS